MSQFSGGQQGRWTVTDENGGALVTFTTFLEMDFKGESKVVEQPTEQGGFVSYNKVQNPSETFVTLGIQGTDTTLGDALTTLEKAQKETTLLSVVTPSKVISSVTLAGINYSRKREDGWGVLYVELHLKEVRQVAAQYAAIPRRQAKNPSDASKQDRGKVQTKSFLKQLGN